MAWKISTLSLQILELHQPVKLSIIDVLIDPETRYLDISASLYRLIIIGKGKVLADAQLDIQNDEIS
jgi:hypothetical protein